MLNFVAVVCPIIFSKASFVRSQTVVADDAIEIAGSRIQVSELPAL